MKKRETHQRSQKAAHRESAYELNGVAVWARALNDAVSEEEVLRSFLPKIFNELEAESLYLATDDGRGHQRVRARVERNREVEIITGGETVSSTHGMLARAPARFDNLTHELAPDEVAGALLCPAAQSALVLPLVIGGKLTGALVASSSHIASFKSEDETVACVAADMLAATLERINLSEQARRAREQEAEARRHAELIEELNSAARSTLDLDRILLHAIDALAHALPASFIVLRSVSFGVPEKVLRAWTTGHDRPPLEVHAPVSKQERAVYSEQRPVFLEDLRAERGASSDLVPLAERLGARSVYFAPVVYGGQVLASLGLVESDAMRRWTADEQMLLVQVAETIAPLILNAQLHARLRTYIEDLLTLLKLAGEVTTETDLDRSLRASLDAWAKIAGADASVILRWDEETKLLRLATSKHLPTALLERYTRGVTLSDSVLGLAAEKRVGVIVDLASEARFAELYSAVRWSGLRGAWATPITGVNNKLLGVLVTFARNVAEVAASEQRLADLFTRPVALAMQNLEWARESRQSAQSAKTMQESLHSSQSHKTEFMSIMSHELRTPLNAIIGYAQMLLDGFSGELNEQQRADVRTVLDSADRLLRMVEDTLDLARMEQERFPVYMDTVAFDEVIQRAVSGVRGAADVKGLDIKTIIAEDAPAIRTDPERVRQILTNLLSNAVKFTETGFVQVSVEPAEAGSVQISVTDTGAGLDVAAFPQLFEEFRQADTSNTRAYSGTGLGLAVSKRLVQRLGGNIGVTSTPGEGSTFWFRLPPEIPGADS
ncbi:MAG: hypothetical protein AUG51_05885 [Acidobacteria bacterium 13_1_20CM_3_53_8]|nr:MAG: hypothetical protein AUG51_05885 [Acidobacteria bacterium 13_1_20CM_3_53_8]